FAAGHAHQLPRRAARRFFSLKFAAVLFEEAAEYRIASELFVRGLAIVYVIAFCSLAVQIDGLVGPDGILPFEQTLALARSTYGPRAVWQLPTLFWLGSSDWALLGSALGGGVLALLLLFGIRYRRSILIALFALYLSLFQAGQIFTSFQW